MAAHEGAAYFCSRGQSNDVPAPEGRHYCVDENTERRNHYLDLAGIENYTSRFEGKCLLFFCCVKVELNNLTRKPLRPYLSLVLQEPLLPFHLRRLKVAAIKARPAHAPRRPRLFTIGARRSSATPTLLRSCEARPSSSNPPKEPTREGTMEPAEVASPLNATATTHIHKACCTAAEPDTEVRTSTTYRTKASRPATISTHCNTATASA